MSRDPRVRPITPADVAPMPHRLLTISDGRYRKLRDGETFPVITFLEPVNGSVVDLRLNATDCATLRRIYGEPKRWVGEYCVVEVRYTAYAGQPKAPHVRVAFPETWRLVVPEVLPVAFDGDAAIREVESSIPHAESET